MSWILDGINKNKAIGKEWHFKGGTCLKKCYFETYRFSEDLDFTLSNKKHLDVYFLLSLFKEICQNIHEETGIEFFFENFKFKIIQKENGKLSAQGKVHYNGPLRRRKGFASIKLDLTTDELLV